VTDPHILALLATAVLVGAAAAASRLWALRGARASLNAPAALPARGHPYVLYFTGPNCSICRTHQEPALKRLDGVDVEKVDAVERSDLAGRFHVFTVPSTVVVAADGRPLAVNYGYTPADKLRSQLAEAARPELARAASF
jgi:thioredoxin-like negative regulator of GroEL